MKNELIQFQTDNNNRYFYDPLLREIFIFNDELFKAREKKCSERLDENDSFPPLTAKEVEFRLANITQVTLELTEKCNLNCHYCAYGSLYSTINRKGSDLPSGFIRNILYYLNEKMNSPLNTSDRNHFYVSFYGGEPLLRFDTIKETVDLVKGMTFKNNRVLFSMTTNAFFLDKYMDYLAENNIRLLISLDGDREGNRLRVDHGEKPQFEKILSNVKRLQSRHPEYFKRNVNFNSVLSKYNSVESITNFIESHFDKRPSVASINPTGLNPDKINDFFKIYSSTPKSFEEADRVMNSKEKYFIHHPEIKNVFMFLRLVLDNSFSDYSSFMMERSANMRPTGTCLPFQKRMFVSADGALLPCENVPKDIAFGYVNEQGVDMDCENVATVFNNAFKEIENQCGRCYGKETCGLCLFQMKTRYKCAEMVSKKELQAKFARAMTFLENNPELYARLMEEVCVE